MTGIITTGNHPKALWPGIKAWWGRQYQEHQEEYSDLFETDTSDKAYEEDVQVTGFGLAPVKAQGAGAQYDSETQGFTSRYTHVAYALGYIVAYEELRDNLYEVVSRRRSQALAFSMRQTKENVAANVYNRAFSGSYIGGDGVSLLSASHPSLAGNWSNILPVAADLSETALEDMIIQIMGATNDRGLKISLMAKSLHTSRQEWFNANRILKSTLQNDTANNAVNVLKATNALPGGVKVNHYFTDQDAWFMRTNAPRGMIHYNRDPITFDQDNDFDTKNAKAMCYERYSFGWTDPRALYGSAGA
ncbi:hypothetical protein L2U69_11845 [Zavarzinia compransoris]|uniref:phage major capsid protein n=1 Tax=Zavarzinia marina TaxID=2911065 RepID=UPI001F335C75|nr:hypothetical protein [Zavarzinia marina]MCF4166339.1 hypothetical protein [Zavarzinia marina]